VPQRMISAARSEPQKKTFVPMINTELPTPPRHDSTGGTV
jgi:hypothetical protein